MNIRDTLKLLTDSPVFRKIEADKVADIQSRRVKAAATVKKGMADELAAVREYERKCITADAAVADAIRVLQECQAVRTNLTVDHLATVGPIQHQVSEARAFLHDTAGPMIGRFIAWNEELRRHLRHNTPPGKVVVHVEDGVLHMVCERKEKVNAIIRALHLVMQEADAMRFEAIAPEALPEALYQLLVDHDITDPAFWFGSAPFDPHAVESEALGLHLAEHVA